MAAPEQEVPNGLQYHFNVIYNYPRSKHSETDDTKLARQVTDYVVEVTAREGFSRAYFHERDCLAGTNVFMELLRVIKLSQYTFVILTPGFVRDCWSRYCQMTAFKILLEKDRASRLIPVAVNLPEESCPQELTTQSVVWLAGDWRNDNEGWNRVFRVLKDKIPVQQTLEQAFNPISPQQETPLSPQNNLQNVPRGIQTSRSVVAEDDNPLNVPTPSLGARDSIDGPLSYREVQPPNRNSQLSGHGSSSQDRERFNDARLFRDGVNRGSDGMRELSQQRRNQAMDQVDAGQGQIETAGGTGQAELRTGPSRTSTVPPRSTGMTDSRPAAREEYTSHRGDKSSGRGDNSAALASSLERKLGLTSKGTEEASWISEATRGPVNTQRAHSQPQGSRPASLQDGLAPRHQHAHAFSQSQGSEDLDSLPSIDGPSQGPGAAPSPASPLTPAAQGGASSTPHDARGTTPRQRELDQATTSSEGRVIPGPNGAMKIPPIVSPSAHGAAADPTGRQAGLLDEEQTFVKSTAPASQVDDSGLGRNSFPEITTNRDSNVSTNISVPMATIGPTPRAQPEGADCGTPDAKVPERDAKEASKKDDHSSAASTSSNENQSPVSTGTTIQLQEQNTSTDVEEHQPHSDQEKRPPSVLQTAFGFMCKILQPGNPDIFKESQELGYWGHMQLMKMYRSQGRERTAEQ